MIIIHTIDCASTKQHLILRQCAGFIGENVLYLTQFFRYVHCSALGSLIRLQIEQIRIVMNVKNLQNFT